MYKLRTIETINGREPSLPSLRIACEVLGLEVWRQGAAWGYDRETLFGRRSFYLSGAYGTETETERYVLRSLLSRTWRGRRMLRKANLT